MVPDYRKWKSKGIRTALGIEIKAKSVVLTNELSLTVRSIGDKTSVGKSRRKRFGWNYRRLNQCRFEAGRMKTGTPPRVDGRSLDYSKMNEEKGDAKPDKFSYSDLTAPLTSKIMSYDLYLWKCMIF
jgi:tRNA uridine 5-carboxymethylaminomethyl modification enzyme